ncbi:HPr kinase/phosphorylase [Govanella unica]|uniref:HPr kinase/phosphatase C-terminal domain-containing protein n=1 Tax=Govanella unica TaxID=2975056 RepID=A0A9X3TZD3_9PROT|nr:HPr kinase/phosphatase C-terminal domain-containing protein [Govania unica]MDA5194564.1 HPr kinase/phosphatase C-terminal domain-containing protein [Govania unica]
MPENMPEKTGALLFHGTAVLWQGAGVLLRAPSGGGKSDLAWRVIAAGGRLIGDDYVWLRGEGGRLYAMAAENIRGRMELRGVGILSVPTTAVAEIHAVIDLMADSSIERLPEARYATLAGVKLPLYGLDPFLAASAAKVAAIAEVCKNRRR